MAAASPAVAPINGGSSSSPAPALPAAAAPPPSSVVPASFPASIPHLFAGQPLAAQMGPAGKVGRFPGCKGTELASYWWPAGQAAAAGPAPTTTTPTTTPATATPPPAKAVVLFVHGHGSYAMHEVLAITAPGTPPVYAGSWVAAWNAAGFSVAALDARGAGFSGGTRCFCEAFDDYTADVAAFAAHTHAAGGPGFGGLPIFLVGVSLGGCIAVHVLEGGWVPPPPPPGAAVDPALARPRPPGPAPYLRGAVLLAPMLALDALTARGWNRVLSAAGAVISVLAPKARVARMPKNTLHPDLQALWDADPLCWHAPTRARNGMEYLRVTRGLAARTPAMAFPFLAFHGDADTLTDPAGTAAFCAAAGSADKTFASLPGRWHVLVREPGNEALLGRIIQWCDERL